jgi:phage tail sheath protein FI
MSVVGIIGTASDADASVFPLNTPVFLYSNDAAKLTALGAAGTLRDAITLLNGQLGSFQVAAKVVVVRVEDGADVDGTIANIVGDGVSTGLSAFLNAGAELGVIPRLLCAPGFTSQRTAPDANAVCAALPAICEKLLAHAVVDGPATTPQDALDWRETLSHYRLIPVDPAVRVLSGTETVVQPLSPAVIGVGVRRDHAFQGRPFHSWANQPVQGIVGPSRPIAFSLTDGATEGQSLLAANIGILLRGEMGVESAIGQGGFIFVGTDNAGEDDLWRFYNVTRGRDYIHLMLLRTLRFYLGRFNITGQTVQAVLNTMETALRNLKADGDILGFEVKFLPAQNSPEELRQGRFTVNFAAEEAPVLRYLGIQSARYRPALDAMLDELLSQVGTITG